MSGIRAGDRVRVKSHNAINERFRGAEGVVLGFTHASSSSAPAGLAKVEFGTQGALSSGTYTVSAVNLEIITATEEPTEPTEAEIRALFNINKCPTCQRPFEEN